MEFLYPTSRQFPFDAACEQIVRELERRNWNVSGVEVEFRTYGSGEQKFRHVDEVRGADFKIRFCRSQGPAGDGTLNDIAGVTEITIPGKEIRVHDDESGPKFYLYVGDNWERDREQFMTSLKVHSRRRGERRWYLEYEGCCTCGDGRPHTHRRRRPPFLAHTNDIGRQHDLNEDKPERFETNKVFDEFRRHLEEVVLSRITAQPVPDETIEMFPEPAPVPWPASLGPLFCFGGERDRRRILQGQTDPNELRPAERYGMDWGGWRLMALDLKSPVEIPDLAREGFLWCGVGAVDTDTPPEQLVVPGYYWWYDRDIYVIRVTPKRANDIYVVDHAAEERRRTELSEVVKSEGRDRLTNDELGDILARRALTLVPAGEYDGSYEKPLVLVHRELDLGEVDVVMRTPQRERRATG